jgi:hypothetical protein
MHLHMCRYQRDTHMPPKQPWPMVGVHCAGCVCIAMMSYRIHVYKQCDTLMSPKQLWPMVGVHCEGHVCIALLCAVRLASYVEFAL